jgi:hypothetical protein
MIVAYKRSWRDVFPERGRISQRKKEKTFGRGSLWKLPQLWKKAKRGAAFSHSCLDKPSPQNVLGLSTVPHRLGEQQQI